MTVNNNIHIRLGACISGLFDQNMSLPQGSVLSITLFGLKKLFPLVLNAVYTMMIFSSVSYCSNHIHIIELHLQKCIGKLSHWGDDTNGFNFLTVCIHTFP